MGLMSQRVNVKKIAVVLLLLMLVSIVCTFGGLGFSLVQLRIAREKGIYPNPEAGMRDRIDQGYRGIQKVEIESSGTNSFDGSQPHIWFVIAKVWANSRADGSPLHGRGYDYPGVFFVHVNGGWVYMPEGAFPMLVGSFMDLFGLEGR